jgi:hypothetical protein
VRGVIAARDENGEDMSIDGPILRAPAPSTGATEPLSRVDESELRPWNGSGFGTADKLESIIGGAVIGGGIGAVATVLGWSLLGAGPRVGLVAVGGGLAAGAAIAFGNDRNAALSAWNASERARVGRDIEAVVDDELANWDHDGNQALDRPSEWRSVDVHDVDGHTKYWDRSEAFTAIPGHEDGTITRDELIAALQTLDTDRNGGIGDSELKAVDGLLSSWQARDAVSGDTED